MRVAEICVHGTRLHVAHGMSKLHMSSLAGAVLAAKKNDSFHLTLSLHNTLVAADSPLTGRS